MSGLDKAEGRVKEPIGALSGDRRLKREGKAAADAKDAAERAADCVTKG